MKSTKGFTLVELLVVLALITLLTASLSLSLSRAQRRTRVARAENDVKVISQAILAYEQYDRKRELPPMTDAEANAATLSFLLGRGGSAASGGQIPTLLMTQLTAGGAILDPWERPYTVSIKKGAGSIAGTGGGALQTGVSFPNFYRLSPEERQ